MSYYTERHRMRKPIERTYIIDPSRYGVILECCERYFTNIAWKYPEECKDGGAYFGINPWKLAEDMRYEIPDLYINDFGQVGVPRVVKSIFSDEPEVDKYNQYALLDFIEFMFNNIHDVEKGDYHKFFNHFHLKTKETRKIRIQFINDINSIFTKTGLLYTLKEDGEVERVIDNDITTPEVVTQVLSVGEVGTKELLKEAIELHRSHDPNAARDSVEKIWDAFERLKTYYTTLDKKGSAEKVVNDLSDGKDEYRNLFEKEFKELTSIGNSFRIRHHETDKIEINDVRYYDYFFNRCLSLIAVAVQYLK